MHRFTINYGSSIRNIDIEDYKFLIGDNYKEKFKIYEIIKSAFSKTPNSEYAIENLQKHSVLFDEKPLDVRNWKYFEITPFFDLENDLKIGTKSLIGKYLDSFSLELEQNEIFSTLQILVNSLNEEFFSKETKLEFGEKEFKLQLANITRSAIIKEVFGQILCEDSDCNHADLSYEEIILLQLKLVEKIAFSNREKLIFLYCNIPFLTSKILEFVIGMKQQGLFVLIETLKIRSVPLEKVTISSRHYIDFANKEDVLDKIMDFPFHITYEDLMNVCETAIISNKFVSSERSLIELFPWEIYT